MVFLEFSRTVHSTVALWKQLEQVHQGKAYAELEKVKDSLDRELEDVKEQTRKRHISDIPTLDEVILQLEVMSSMMNRLSNWRGPAAGYSSSTGVGLEEGNTRNKAEDELIQRQRLGFSALHAAVVNESTNNWEYTELSELARRSNKERQGHFDIFDRTPLHYISTRTNLKYEDITMLVKVLSDAGFHMPTEGYLDMTDLIGLTPLHYAVYLKNVAAIKALLRLKCDINVRGIDGISALHLAAATGFKDSTTAILEGLEDSVDDIVDNRGRTALHWAVISGATEVAEALLDNGASITVKDKYRRTPVHLTPFTAPTEHNNVSGELLQLFIDKKQTEFIRATKERDDDGCTVLHLGAKAGRLAIIKRVIEGKTSAEQQQSDLSPGMPAPAQMKLGKVGTVDISDNHGRTALSFAAEGGEEDIAQYLLDAGARVDLKDDSKRSPLYWAVVKKHTDVMKLLMKHIRERMPVEKLRDQNTLDMRQFPDTKKSEHTSEGFDLNLHNDKGQSLLLWAARNGHEEAVLLLLDKNCAHAVDVNSKDEDGQTALTWAAKQGHLVAVKLLIDHESVEIDTKDCSGNTPLIWAAIQGHKDVVELLINSRADPLCYDNVYHQTPLSWAMENKHTPVAELLLRDKHIDINAQDPYWHYNPLGWAIAEGHEDIAQMLMSDSRIEQATVLSLFGSNTMPLSMFRSTNTMDFLVDLILKRPTLLKTFGGLLLQVAVICERQQAVKKLIAAGANKRWEDIHGWTPLLCAIVSPREGIRELFADSLNQHALPQYALAWDPKCKAPISLDEGYLTATCT